MLDPTLIGLAFAVFTGALGFLLSREIGRADGTSNRAIRSSEALSTIASQLESMREATRADICRLEADQATSAATQAALRETMREQFQAHQAAFEARLAAQRDSTHKIQESWNTAMNSLSSAVARLEATVTSLSTQIESLTAAERQRTAQRSPELNITDKLREFAELQRLLAKP